MISSNIFFTDCIYYIILSGFSAGVVSWRVADVACRSTLTENLVFSKVNAIRTCHHKKTRHDTTLGCRPLALSR